MWFLQYVLYFFIQQQHYQGLIEFAENADDNENADVNENGEELKEEDAATSFIPYGITGLVDKKTVLQCGEKVLPFSGI